MLETILDTLQSPGQEDQQESACNLVVDASFLLRAQRRTAWAVLVLDHIEKTRPKIIVPKRVLDELEAHYKKKTMQDGIPLLLAQPELETLVFGETIQLGANHNFCVTPDLPYSKFASLLRITERSVIATVLDLASAGKEITVATGDRAMAHEIRVAAADQSLPVHFFAPWTLPLSLIDKTLTPDLYVTSNVFGELYAQIGEGNIKGLYLCVAKGVGVHGQGKYDIGFKVLKRTSIDQKLPSRYAIETIPVVPITSENGVIVPVENDWRPWLSPASIIYGSQHPYGMGLFSNSKPMKMHEIKRLIDRYRNQELTSEELAEKLAGDNFKQKKWLRIHDDTIQLFDSDATQKLNYFRKEIAVR